MIKNRIFIIDYDPFWTSSLKAQLEAQNHTQIHAFKSGAAALEQLHLNPYLVFLDYQMAEMDGLEVLKGIKAYYPGISVVFCTALEDLSVAIQALEAGSFEYLLKSNLAPQPLEAILHKAGEHFFKPLPKTSTLNHAKHRTKRFYLIGPRGHAIAAPFFSTTGCHGICGHPGNLVLPS